MSPAKRGDLVIVHVRTRTYAVSGPTEECDEYHVGEVTSVTRDGMVKRWRRCDDLAETDYRGKPNTGAELARVCGYVRHVIAPAAQIDVPSALVTAATHTYERSAHTRAHGSLNDVRAALRPHLLSSPALVALREAARAWREARRAASTALRASEAEAGRALRDAGYHTRDGNAAYDRITRAALQAWSEANIAADSAYRASYAALAAPAATAAA